MTGASPHFSKVDENPANGDTDFISFNGNGSEAYGMNASAIPQGSMVLSVRIRVNAKGSTGGARTLQFGYRFNGVDYWLGSITPSPSSYGSAQAILTENLATAALFEEQHIRTSSIMALRAEWLTDGLAFPAPRMTQCVMFATIPDPASALTDLEIAEFWRIHRLVRRKEMNPPQTPTTILVTRYKYLRDRANANAQTLLPPQDLIDSDYLAGLHAAKRRF
jgi:hypothetical protein